MRNLAFAALASLTFSGCAFKGAGIPGAPISFANADYAVITDGLRPGERLVVSALRNPISGMALATIDERVYAFRGN